MAAIERTMPDVKGTREPKSRVVHARLSGREFEAATAAAEQAGMSLSAFMRSLTLDGAGVVPFLTEDDRAIFLLLHRELRALGVNLNGLARGAHSGLVQREAEDILRALQPVVAALAIELRALSVHVGRLRQEQA